MGSDSLSVIGFFLTLFGLLGSFFAIHLSDWYRDVQALATKWDINKRGDSDEYRTGRRECRYEIERVGGKTTLITSLVISAFLLLVFGLSVALWRAESQHNAVWWAVGVAGLGFLAIYLGMTIGFLAAGYRTVRQVRREIAERFAKKQPV